MKDKMIKVGLFFGGAVVGAISFSILRDKFERKAINEIFTLSFWDKNGRDLETLIDTKKKLRTIHHKYNWALSTLSRVDLYDTMAIVEECTRRHQNER